MNQQVLIIGGSGFVGSHLTRELLAQNYAVSVVKRSNSASKYLLDTRATVIHHHDFSEMGVRELLGHVQKDAVVINLVGVLHAKQDDPYGPEFLEAHVNIPTYIISAMKFLGMKRYLHMSALGADADGTSMYLRSKGDAEDMVRNSGLDFTIFRPSVIFGKDDQFINMFGKLQKYFPIMPLGGAKVLFQPVSVDDVSKAFTQAIAMPETIHQAIDLCGPRVYSLGEIVQFSAKRVGVSRPVIPLPNWAAYLQACLLELMPGPKVMSRDNVASMKTPSVLLVGLPNPLEQVFGISPTPLESLLK
jgi:NADH dehydrogenase